MSAYSRYTGIDVRDKIIDLLENGGTRKTGIVHQSFSDALTDIDTKRSTSTITPKMIGYSYPTDFPYLVVDINSSDIKQDELITDDYERLPEIFSCTIIFEINDDWDKVQNYIENYIEAVIKSLNGYCDNYISWMLVTGTDKTNTYTLNNSAVRAASVNLEIRIN